MFRDENSLKIKAHIFFSSCTQLAACPETRVHLIEDLTVEKFHECFKEMQELVVHHVRTVDLNIPGNSIYTVYLPLLKVHHHSSYH